MQRPTLTGITIASVAFASFIGGLHAAGGSWFNDVPRDHWAADAIAYVSDAGLMNGMDAVTFAPNKPVTRAELAMVLYRQRDEDAYVPEPEPYVEPTYDPPTKDDDEVLGNARAKITLIEFGDYQCPFCQRHFEQTLPQIKENYIDTGKVKFVFRDFPLSFHPDAHKAAEAAECAGEQNKYWEMHDMLYETQGEWSTDNYATTTFKGYAKDLGLDTGDFNDCLDSGEMASEVDSDMADGTASGINGTPGFWIIGPNGQSKQISGAYPYQTFADAFDEML